MVASSSSAVGEPGTADLDWANLGFEFRPTKSHLKVVWSVTDEETGEGAWGEPEMVEGDPYINLHVGATALHYGQSCFEGLKAFAHGDGSVHLFRPDENAKRIRSSCERLMMPAPPPDFFVEACARVVADNVAYVPPHGSGGALYHRPLLFGSGPRIGLQPADEYTLLILVMPVGDYYKGARRRSRPRCRRPNRLSCRRRSPARSRRLSRRPSRRCSRPRFRRVSRI